MTTKKANATTKVGTEREPIYFTVGEAKYRLAFTIMQWEQQLKLTEEHPGTLGALTSMIYSAMSIANRQDQWTSERKPLQLGFEEVEMAVDQMITNHPEEMAKIIAYRNEVPFYKKALETLQEPKDVNILSTPGFLSEMMSVK